MRATPILLAAVIILFGGDAAFSQSPEFSWMSLLGRAAVHLTNAMGAEANCSINQHSVNLGAPDRKRKVGWDASTGSGFVVVDPFPLRTIQVATCKLDPNTNVKAMIHNGSIFSIEVNYNRCGDNLSECSLAPKAIDKKAIDMFGDELIVRPFAGAAKVSDEVYDRFKKAEGQFPEDTIERTRFQNATYCSIPYSLLHRCLFGLRREGSRLQIVTLAEVSSGYFFNRQIDRYLISQTFSDLNAEREAYLAFDAEVSRIMSRMAEQDEKERGERERRKSVLETVR